MKLTTAVLAAASVGAVGIWCAERRNRRLLWLGSAALHQKLLADIAGDPGHAAVWAPEGLPIEQSVPLVHCNRLISFLAVKYRIGLLDKATLRVQARALMEHDEARAYWARSGPFREEEAMDGTDRAFNRILNDEYTAATDTTEPVRA
ncbi:DUF6082 family protein [Streptomyces ardesiacus]|uniref:DUF6082 family protein n=1 Tax=Streptomyces ardesiacus TaxID=285564 RepID=UPI0006E1C414|nr:DUF6082 family protein [Streptomyces sp. NBRC 110030]